MVEIQIELHDDPRVDTKLESDAKENNVDIKYVRMNKNNGYDVTLEGDRPDIHKLLKYWGFDAKSIYDLVYATRNVEESKKLKEDTFEDGENRMNEDIKIEDGIIDVSCLDLDDAENIIFDSIDADEILTDLIGYIGTEMYLSFLIDEIQIYGLDVVEE